MSSPTNVIPERLMTYQGKQEVIKFLIAAPLPAQLKRNLLQGWAMTVGLRIKASDYKKVYDSGIDVQ